MSLESPDFGPVPEAPNFKIAVVAAQFNPRWTDLLLSKTRQALLAAGVEEKHLRIYRVPGSNEIPFAVQMAAESGQIDAVIGLGVLKKGATAHYHIVAQSVSDALQMVALNTGVPVINGVIVVENEEQAAERVDGDIDRAAEFAQTALVMAQVRVQLGELFQE